MRLCLTRFCFAAACAVALIVPGSGKAQAVAQPRTVIDNELGSIFTWPNSASGFGWHDVGAIVNTNMFFANTPNLNPQSIKVVHARFHVFKPSDDYTWAWFPYSALRAYESQEVRAGRPPIFVTATYHGKQRPVVWSWSLALNGDVPTTPQSEWRYAVNVQDDRFIKFWLNKYVREILFKDLNTVQNLWVGLDEAAFNPDIYGVLDDYNHFVPGVAWDAPFPQGETQYLDSIRAFFTRVKQLAPDINLMPNSGGVKTWSRFADVFGAVPGIMVEEINPIGTMSVPSYAAYTRNAHCDEMVAYAGSASRGQTMILQSYVPQDASRIRSSYATYLLLKGPNTFYAPTIDGSYYAPSPSTYQIADALLGNPTGSMQTMPGDGTSPGAVLYVRQFEGGTVYLNWTGASKTISFPAGQQYYTVEGNPVSQITLADLAAEYVLNYTGGPHRSSKPRINPRYASPVSGPLNVTITNSDSTGVTYYTLNGYTPYTYSPVYNDPLSLTATATVKARVDRPLTWTSFSNQANYTISLTLPEVKFVTASESGPADTYYPIVGLSAISTAPVTVQYNAQPHTGTAVQGTLTFAPGDLYRSFPVAVPDSTIVTLSQPQGAILGMQASVWYAVQ